MAAKVYSTRFFHFAGANDARTYYVPMSKRMVIKWCALTNFGAAEAQAYVRIAGVAVYNRYLPATTATVNVEMMLVAMMGEAVSVTVIGPDVRVSVSGYLFDDLPAASTKPSEPEKPAPELPVPFRP
jgi:hypothetical protein